MNAGSIRPPQRTSPRGEVTATLTSTAPARLDDIAVRYNWNTKIAIKPRAFHQPTSEGEIASIVRHERFVRVGGGLHSFNEALLPGPGGAFIDMSRFNNIATPVKQADGSYTVRVQAGATVAELTAALAKHGLALENLPSSEKISIGGAIANGAHGTGLTSPAVLAEQVVGMTVVTSDGEKKTIAQEDLPLYRINLGLLGIATTIELRCVPDFDLVSADDVSTGEAAIVAALEPTKLRAEVSRFQSINYLINPNLEDPSATSLTRWALIKVTNENRAEVEARNLPRKTEYDTRTEAQKRTYAQAYGAAAAASGWVAKQLKASIRDRISKPHEPTIGRSALMYQTFGDIPVHDVSYGVPFEKAQETFKRVMAKMRELGYETPVPMSMRFLRGTDATLMGMNSGRDVVTFELFTHVLFDDPRTGALRPDVKEAEDAFEKIMIEMGGRPHWGKEYFVNPKDRFEARTWNRFADEAKRVGGKLTNAWSAKFTPTA